MPLPYTNSYWPTDYNGCTIEGTYVGLDGQPIQGTITFQATPVILLDYTAVKSIVPRALSATLDSNGHFSIVLPATDDDTVSPNGFTYTVTQSWIGALPPFSITAPGGTTQDITEVTPVPDSLGNPIVRGPRGIDGSLISVQGITGDEYGNAVISTIVPLRANNLGDLPSPSAARANLGSGGLLQVNNNLGDVENIALARAALDLGTAALEESTYFLTSAGNLGDLPSYETAQTNLRMPKGFLGEAGSTAGAVTLASLGTLYLVDVSGTLTVTLPKNTTVRLVARAGFQLSSGGPARYTVRTAYIAGSGAAWTAAAATAALAGGGSTGGASTGNGTPHVVSATGINDYVWVEDCFTLAAGTYTFGLISERDTAGSSLDTTSGQRILLTEIGPQTT